MPNPERDDSARKRPKPTPEPDRKAEQRAKDGLREQSKTEVEERPYLDTEGGE
jgi:hypothetical protein